MTLPLHALISERTHAAGVRQLTPAELDLLVRYYALLERWNQKINLTALPLAARERPTIDRLIVEPLIAAAEVDDQAVLTWFDFGSGGGSPAIPLKIVRPRMTLTMVESRERKAAFLREAVSTLSLSSTSVTTSRIEELLQSRAPASVDLITMRALRLDPEILGTARSLLKLRGRVLLFQGEPAVAQTDLRGLTFTSCRPLTPSRGSVLTLQKLA